MDKTALKQALEGLIKLSPGLNENQKTIYGTLINFMPEEQLNQLYAIFKNEADELVKIKGEQLDKETEINKKYLDELNAFPAEIKAAVAAEENKDKVQGEAVLQELNNA